MFSSAVDDGADGCDAVRTIIRGVVQLFPEHIGVDFRIGIGAAGLPEEGFHLADEVVDAIHDAVGVWVSQLPATPERILAALGPAS